ncbi:MAG: putative sporulation protein YtxC [Clostridia bacterium]
MKSLCIKTNNSDLLQYLLNELNNLELEQVYFSCNKFKHYKNIIIHYTGKDNDLFLNKISSILSLLVLDELEEDFLKKILLQNYFYFDSKERNQILNLCFDITANNFSVIFDKKFKALFYSFYNFLSNNKSLVLKGFTNFRIKSYLKILDDIVNEAVNNFIIEKEYLEFISLLKLYINSQNSNCEIVHMIYSSTESILLDENKEIITISNDNFKAKYLSDITFSSNDYTLNSLLTLLPKKIYIHLIDDGIDEFITTLQAVFENRIYICRDCNICKLYKNSLEQIGKP